MKRGGALYFTDGGISPHLDNCLFQNNAAASKGGAIYTDKTASCKIFHSHFINNTASEGGAVFAKNGTLPLHVWNCTFSGNSASTSGGVLQAMHIAMNITGGDFSINRSPLASVIYFEGRMYSLFLTKSKIFKNNFEKNFTQSDLEFGSSIFVSYATQFLAKSIVFENNSLGGAVILGETRGEIHNCTFYRNSADFGAGAISSKTPILLLIKNSSFVENRGSSGGSLSLLGGHTLIQNSQFVSTFGPFHIQVFVSQIAEVRFMGNTFTQLNSSSLDTMVFLSVRKDIVPVILYFWQTSFEFLNQSKIPLEGTTGDFIKLNDVELRESLSQFASGLSMVTCRKKCLQPDFLQQIPIDTEAAMVPNMSLHFPEALNILFSVFPLPCLDGCVCYYSVEHLANTVNCSHNNMGKLPDAILPNTEQLVMRGNSIGVLDQAHISLTSVKTFDLQMSDITFVKDDALVILLKNADELRLSNNKMTKLSGFFQKVSTNTHIWLANNPYECNCDMMWMRDWLLNVTNVQDKDEIICGEGKWQGKVQRILIP